MDIRIRTAGIEDVAHLLRHRRAMFEEIGHRDAAILERVDQFSLQYFHHAIPAGRYKGWLAEDSAGRVVAGGGIVISDWPGYPGENHAKRVWILNMYTEPDARRCGIAKRLVESMVEWCRANGFRMVSLHASAAGRPLYESLDFQPTNEMTLRL
jgi:GNAT superfamily N-acetyltransferase